MDTNNKKLDTELYYKGYRAFLDGLRYGDMKTNAECEGWEAAWHDAHAAGQRIARRGR